MKTTANFNEFSNICKNIAAELDTIVKIKNYENYGFAQVSFMTDNFGGTYAIFKFDHKTKEVKWYEFGNEKTISDEHQLRMFIKLNLNKMLEERDLDEIYNKINAE